MHDATFNRPMIDRVHSPQSRVTGIRIKALLNRLLALAKQPTSRWVIQLILDGLHLPTNPRSASQQTCNRSGQP